MTTPDGAHGLTPEKLAAFYRAVGGNYDTLFLSTPPCSLSFIYKSLGCFHTLQPTCNAFEAPSIPALLPEGFIRWQTIQLLLCPDEHAAFLKEALRRLDIVNPSTGTLFPKDIPRSAFPAGPDPEMVQWHDTVGTRLEREYKANQTRETSRHRSSRPQEEMPAARDHRRSRSSGSQAEFSRRDYFSSRPKCRSKSSRTPPHEEYSPRSRPSHRGDHIDDPLELDSDSMEQSTPKFYVVDSEDESRPQRHSRQPSRSASRQSRTRSQSRASSKRRFHRRTEVNDLSLSEDDSGGQRGRVSSNKRAHHRTHTSRSADGRRLHPQLLSPETSVYPRRHSHESPHPSRNGSVPAHRSPHSPRQCRDRISVEILSSDTEAETDLDRTTSNEQTTPPLRSRGFYKKDRSYVDEDEVDPRYTAHYSPDSKHARDFYYYDPNLRFDARKSYSHPNLSSHHGPHYPQQPQPQPHHHRQRQRPHGPEPEYIILPQTTPSESTSSTSPPSSPVRGKKYKEYIIIDPDGRTATTTTRASPSPTSSSTSTTPASAEHYARVRRPSITTSSRPRSQSRYRQSPTTIAATSGSAHLAAPLQPVSRHQSVKTLGGHRNSVPVATTHLAGSYSSSGSGNSGSRFRGVRHG
jgi:hypothetical protein